MTFSLLNGIPAPIIAVIAVFAGCTSTYQTRSVGKGNLGIEATLGGPMMTNLGAPIPMPNCFLGARYGVRENLDLCGVTFLYCHGNSGDLFRYWYRAVALWSMGANVFIFTYRGYGLSKGTTTRSSILADCDGAAAYIKSRPDVDTNAIIVYGYSMGAIPASYLAGVSQHKAGFAGVILESGMDSPENVVALSTGVEFPNDFFFDKTDFDGTGFIKHTTLPVLHVHGGKDERVVIGQAEKYYEILKGRDNYTHYIGKNDNAVETWVRETEHRNVPVHAFKAESQLSDYYDDPANPHHCCIHPDDYADPLFEDFLETAGKTDVAAMIASAGDYRSLIVSWVQNILQ